MSEGNVYVQSETFIRPIPRASTYARSCSWHDRPNTGQYRKGHLGGQMVSHRLGGNGYISSGCRLHFWERGSARRHDTQHCRRRDGHSSVDCVYLSAAPTLPPLHLRLWAWGDVAGVMIVLTILFSAVVAGYESINRSLHPQSVEHLWAVAIASIVGFAGNELVAIFPHSGGQTGQQRRSRGRRLPFSCRWLDQFRRVV